MTEQGTLESRFRHYLCTSGIRPGEKLLTELQLMKAFQVSRGDIRKVLTALCRDGILERRPRIGTVVRDFNPTTVSEDLAFRFQLASLDPADALEARRTIELAIIPLVIRRITPQSLSRLSGHIDRMEACIESPLQADTADRDFHFELLNACGNQTLQAFAGVIAGLFHPDLRRKWYGKTCLKRAIKEHRDIVKAIEAEDIPRVTELITHHFSKRGEAQ